MNSVVLFEYRVEHRTSVPERSPALKARFCKILNRCYHESMRSRLFAVLAGALIFGLVPHLGAQEYEEQSYDDLVRQLQSSKRRAEFTSSPNAFDELSLHAGLGLVSATNQLQIGDTRGDRTLSGFQISLGIDLFSPYWLSEVILRNFGTTEHHGEIRSLREVDLRVSYRALLSQGLGYRLGAGLGTRYFSFNNESRGIALRSETPCWLISGSLESYVSRNLSLGVELGLRSAFIRRSFDQSAIDVMVRLDTFF